MKKKVMKIGSIIIIMILVIIIMLSISPILLPIVVQNKIEYGKPSQKETMLYKFIDTKMENSDGGIKTNYLQQKNEGIITKGKSVLSESEGFMLLYYLERNDKEGFGNTYDFIRKNMILKDGLISWRVDGKAKNSATSTIDDLRIVKGLLLASEKWNNIYYRYEAIILANSIYKNLNEQDLLVDYKGSNIDTLSYMDVQTLKYLSEIDGKWKKIYIRSKNILNGGYISNEFPFYREEYNLKSGEYDNLAYVNTLNTTIIVLNKLGAGENVETTVNWFTKELKEQGAIYAKYDINTGEPLTNIQSTAIYANLIQIAKITKNEELYKLATEKFYEFQVLNEKSEIYGAFGNAKTLSVYSFDNMNALLAFRTLSS